MTLATLVRRSRLLAAWGWPVERLPAGALLAQWREVLTLLYRDHSIRALAELTGITTYTLSRELSALGIARRPQGAPELLKRRTIICTSTR